MKLQAYRSLANTLQGYIAQGTRKLLVTSSGPGEGKSTVTANVGRALARTGKLSVVLVDADPFRPTLHSVVKVQNLRGLGDLLREVYHAPLSKETTGGFGLGDWIEVLRAQSKTGRLKIVQGQEEFQLVFDRGKVASLSCRERSEDQLLGSLLERQGIISADQKKAALRVQKEGAKRLGEILHGLGYAEPDDIGVALESQVKETLHKMVTLQGPKYEFQESAQAFQPALAGRASTRLEIHGIDHLITARFVDHLKHPFLSSRVASYVSDTDTENLKLLTRGSVPYDLDDTGFELLMDRLARSFDVVLMDCPPVAITSPMHLLTSTANGVLLVVQAEGYDVRIVQRAKDQIVKSGANLLGVVLNRVDLRQDKSLSYYYGAYQA
jgi:cellulose biosynthesis protein BcsQ